MCFWREGRGETDKTGETLGPGERLGLGRTGGTVGRVSGGVRAFINRRGTGWTNETDETVGRCVHGGMVEVYVGPT